MGDNNQTSEGFLDALDDVHTRFLLNLPPEELASADRIFFQIEQAWWFYEDMICDNLEPEQLAHFPRFKLLKLFAVKMFQFSPLLDENAFQSMWIQFNEYKRKISTYGTILLNKDATKMVLVQTWTGNTWTVPAGKINQGERGVDAAGRECYEETGFDPNCKMGSTKEWAEQQSPFITWRYPLKEEHYFSFEEADGKRRTYYVCWGVPEDFPFQPVARKEISEVSWFDLGALPKKSYAVLPVMGNLRKWIRKKVKKEGKNSKRDQSRSKSNNRDKSNGRDKSSSRRGSKPRLIQQDNDPLVDTGLASVGDATRWSEEDMFKANEQLLGRKVDYDGNPHFFAEHGFGGNDPHAFRVVGGGFMNSGDGLSHITKEEQKSKYQPLVNERSDDSAFLTPFFSEDGATPWGEVVEEAKSDAIVPQKRSKSKAANKGPAKATSSNQPPDDLDVLTDSQITKKSQERHFASQKQKMQMQYEKDMSFIQNWVSQLPNPTNFRIQNVEAIMQHHFGYT
eukprot:Nitzschia sp. Nitz4//scaffold49_size126201//124350//125876//NITZ4_003664-RA/size126201-processed-gene-0.104-mRNA-1//-1//CDS//3329553215//4006//frame0